MGRRMGIVAQLFSYFHLIPSSRGSLRILVFFRVRIHELRNVIIAQDAMSLRRVLFVLIASSCWWTAVVEDTPLIV